MYEQYFALSERPFSIAPNPRYLFMSAQHQEAEACLRYGFGGEGGIIVLTGEVGAGKTTICRHVLQTLADDLDIALIINPKLSALELLANICDELHIAQPPGASIKTLTDAINTYLLAAYAAGRHVVLLIDEAQNLMPDVMEQLRLLTNLETDCRKLLQIVLVGQPELNAILQRVDLRQLDQRVIARFHLRALSGKECEAYVRHRLQVAGCRKMLFSPAAMRVLVQASQGIPRLMNLMADRALLGAYAEEKSQVSAPIMRRAVCEVQGADALNRRSVTWWAGAMLLAGLAALVFWRISFQPLPEMPRVAVSEGHEARGLSLVEALEAPAVDLEPSRDLALQPVLAAWGLAYHPDSDGDACDFAGRYGLGCFRQYGDMQAMRRLGVPAVMRMEGDGGDAWLPVLSMGEATALVGKRRERVGQRMLAASMRNDFVVLWRMPEGYREPLHIGHAGPVVQSLSEMLQKVAPDIQSTTSYFDEHLQSLLERFQQEEGMRADGVAGPQTWIHLQRRAHLSMPVLFSGELG